MDERLGLAREWERLLATVTAHAARATTALAEAQIAAGAVDDLRAPALIGAQLGVSAWEADNRTLTCRTLRNLPALSAALHAGQISWGQTRTIASQLLILDPSRITREQLDAAETQLLRLARAGAGPARLRREAARIADALDVSAPPTLPAQHVERSLKMRRNPTSGGAAGGTLSFWGELPWEHGALFAGVIDRLAGAYHPEDGRNIDTRRADALLELARLGADAAPPATGSRAAVQLVVSADTLNGNTDEPGELNGTPIPADTARKIACDAAWYTRLVTEPATGRLLDYGRTRRDPTDRLRGYLIARDQHCQFPECTRHAARCDIHHATHWSRGGTTDRTNCLALCATHHSYVHELRWKIIRHPDETTTWLSPTGIRHHVTPPAVLAGRLPHPHTPLPDPVNDTPPYRLPDQADLLDWLTDPNQEPPDQDHYTDLVIDTRPIPDKRPVTQRLAAPLGPYR